MSSQPRILVVEDEVAIQELLRYSLEQAAFEVVIADTAEEALTEIHAQLPAMVLLDLMLPGMSGVTLAKRLRGEARTRELPIIMVTARAGENDRVQGLDVGADDYVSKPFSPKELIARIRALLRRSLPVEEQQPMEFDGLRLDPLAHRVFADARPVEMGPTEFRLLQFLMSHPDRAYSRAQLLDQVWGANVYIDERTVDVHVRRLRKALEPPVTGAKDFGEFIQTVRGTGYRFSNQMSRA